MAQSGSTIEQGLVGEPVIIAPYLKYVGFWVKVPELPGPSQLETTNDGESRRGER
jgi:hypothetical protein